VKGARPFKTRYAELARLEHPKFWPVTSLHEAISSMERRMIQDAMHQADFNQSQAALLLGLSERMLRYKLKKYPLTGRSGNSGRV